MKLVLIWIPLIIISMLGFPDNTSVSHKKADIGQALAEQAPPDTVQATNLKKAVAEWISALTKEAEFKEWKAAKWESLPLGPGTHSWLIVIRKEQLEVGYMIVGAMEDGKHYKLLEYGLGKQPLFSLNTLYQSMIRQALIDSSITYAAFTQDVNWSKERYYMGTLESFWRITHGTEIYYLDAKNGELLLNSVNPLEKIQPSANPDTYQSDSNAISNLYPAHIKESIVSPSYDPFENPSWVNGKPLSIKTMLDLKLALQEHPEMTFMAKLYHQKMIYPFALIGYQLWNEGQAYIALDADGARYIPLSSLLQAGAFYP